MYDNSSVLVALLFIFVKNTLLKVIFFIFSVFLRIRCIVRIKSIWTKDLVNQILHRFVSMQFCYICHSVCTNEVGSGTHVFIKIKKICFPAIFRSVTLKQVIWR